MSNCLCCHIPLSGDRFLLQCWRTDTPQDASGNELFFEYSEIFCVCYDCSPPFLAETSEPMIIKGEKDVFWVVDRVMEVKNKEEGN